MPFGCLCCATHVTLMYVLMHAGRFDIYNAAEIFFPNLQADSRTWMFAWCMMHDVHKHDACKDGFISVLWSLSQGPWRMHVWCRNLESFMNVSMMWYFLVTDRRINEEADSWSWRAKVKTSHHRPYCVNMTSIEFLYCCCKTTKPRKSNWTAVNDPSALGLSVHVIK